MAGLLISWGGLRMITDTAGSLQFDMKEYFTGVHKKTKMFVRCINRIESKEILAKRYPLNLKGDELGAYR